jgi:hypothetical protein
LPIWYSCISPCFSLDFFIWFWYVFASALFGGPIVTLQAQKEYPPDMQSKDKFLIQSTKVAASTDMDEIPPDTVSIELHNDRFLWFSVALSSG